MSEHDPLCPCFSHPDWLPEYNCRCDLIAAVGGRIAQAIEARRDAHHYYEGTYPAMTDAARIARQGGSDE